MQFFDQTAGLSALVLATFCVFGAAFDLKSRRLPNLLSLAAWIAGIGFALAAGGLAGALSPLGHSLIALVVGMGLFRLGAIGGGDAKFYAGIAAWFALGQGLLLLLCVALAGAVLVVAMMGAGMLRRQNREDRRRTMSELPYGVAIAAGAAASWLIASG